jgi:hypothetical protein
VWAPEMDEKKLDYDEEALNDLFKDDFSDDE